jgi:hypothetical protein
MPALTVSVADMVGALERAAGPQVSALIDWFPDPVVAGMVASWPARFRSGRGPAGPGRDPDFDSVIRMHLTESAAAVSG